MDTTFAHVRPAVVVHLGTMIGGHYIAYCLVDPDKMFIDPAVPVDGLASLSIDGGSHPTKSPPGKDKRVWCYCSE